MAMLTTDRNTKSKSVGDMRSLRVAAGETIYQGAMVATNSAGYAVPAEDVGSQSWRDVLGVADETIDNSSGADGDVRVQVQCGVFAMYNDGTITVAETGEWVYALDDQTVTNNPANGTYAGIVVDYRDQDDGLVYIGIP